MAKREKKILAGAIEIQKESKAPVRQLVNAEVNSVVVITDSSTRTKLHSTSKDLWMSCANEVWPESYKTL